MPAQSNDRVFTANSKERTAGGFQEWWEFEDATVIQYEDTANVGIDHAIAAGGHARNRPLTGHSEGDPR